MSCWLFFQQRSFLFMMRRVAHRRGAHLLRRRCFSVEFSPPLFLRTKLLCVHLFFCWLCLLNFFYQGFFRRPWIFFSLEGFLTEVPERSRMWLGYSAGFRCHFTSPPVSIWGVKSARRPSDDLILCKGVWARDGRSPAGIYYVFARVAPPLMDLRCKRLYHSPMNRFFCFFFLCYPRLPNLPPSLLWFACSALSPAVFFLTKISRIHEKNGQFFPILFHS